MVFGHNQGELQAARQFVEKIIAENPVVIFSKFYCPYCATAKATIRQSGARYKSIDLLKSHDGISGGAIKRVLQEKTGRSTVSNVFIRGQSVGGGSEIVSLKASGKLTPMLRDAHAIAQSFLLKERIYNFRI